ncbi:MAG: flagellar hook-basal body protein [Verrucomicrobia bacterium]|nr:flagellar hook-basal body protein [Verrucomicrobiota bacterium]
MNVSLYQAAAALNANARWQEIISENLASSNIPGFKRQDVSFASVQAGLLTDPALSGVAGASYSSLPAGHTATSFAAGQLQATGLATDLALEGSGFFQVRLANGELAYTRDGELRLDAQGQLVTKQGHAIMGVDGPIALDPSRPDALSVSPTGEVSQGRDSRGTLRLVDFQKPHLLTHLGGGYFRANDPSLLPLPADARVKQNYLEAANTTPVHEMVNLMTALRSYQANHKVIQMADERMGTTIRDLAGLP